MGSVTQDLPRTLQEALVCFGDPGNAFAAAVTLRWPNGITCPRCGSPEYRVINSRRCWFCKACKKQFTIKVATVFEDSPVGMDKWMMVVWMVVNCRNGVTSREIARTCELTQKSAWYMRDRVCKAMAIGSFQKYAANVVSEKSEAVVKH